MGCCGSHDRTVGQSFVSGLTMPSKEWRADTPDERRNDCAPKGRPYTWPHATSERFTELHARATGFGMSTNPTDPLPGGRL
jgi:hypothetical protein